MRQVCLTVIVNSREKPRFNTFFNESKKKITTISMRARLHIISRYKEFANTFSDPGRIPNASVKEIHRQTTSRIMKSRCFNQPCTLFLYIYFPQSYFSCADYPINELLSPQNPYFFLCDNPVFILFWCVLTDSTQMIQS